MNSHSLPTKAIIFGVSGKRLTEAEKIFFTEVRPFGFILFARNIDTPLQVKQLVAELRQTVGRRDAPVLIDQEGGRVARLRPPYWRAHPPAQAFGALYSQNANAATEAAYINGLLLGHMVGSLGFNVNCAPVLDVLQPGTTAAIGDRAYSDNPDIVIALGKAMADGLLASGVLPVVKHLPGHGRARLDSHEVMPVVSARLDVLAADFAPFQALRDLPLGMTCHLLYSAIDQLRPATLSPIIVQQIIRERIGFDGLLLTDDLDMKALRADIATICEQAIESGCDILLQCNGQMERMIEFAAAAPVLSEAAQRRWALARQKLGAAKPFDVAAAESQLDLLLAGIGAAVFT